MRPTQQFLREVREGLALRLPSSEINTRIEEIAAHLDDAVEAHREMGGSETTAVVAMGCPRRLARRLAAEASVHWDHRRLYFAAVALAGYGANLAGISVFGMPWLTKAVAVISVAATVAMAFAAMRARSVRLSAIFMMGVILMVPATLMRSSLFVNTEYPLGRANLPRAFVADRLRQASDEDRAALVEAVAEPFWLQAERQVPFAAAASAELVAILGAVDAGFGVLGLAMLAARRRVRARGGTPVR